MTIRHMIAGVLLALSILAAYYGYQLLRSCARIRADYERELIIPLAQVPVDLSIPGTSRTRFTYDYLPGHGFVIALLGIDPSSTPGEPPKEIDGLKATVTLVDGPRQAQIDSRPYEIDYSSGMLRDPSATGLISFGGYYPIGEYEIDFVVQQPAPAMAGAPHRVVIYTQVCGCETLGCIIAVPIAGVLLLFAMIAGSWSCIAFFARARPQHRPHGQTSIADPAASTLEIG